MQAQSDIRAALRWVEINMRDSCLQIRIHGAQTKVDVSKMK